ncbi:hypothetical protein IFR05_006772 [Cadophora sp. M221]|nr:hypothetical protein IFR05_006772 [Cadophora sp. M221]
MGNFKCFPMGYLISAYEPMLFLNVSSIIKQANESGRGPSRFHSIFDLRDVFYVMENIMAFDAGTDPDHKLSFQALTMATKMHIKNELARYLRRPDKKDPAKDALSLDERLSCLQGVLEDLRGMQDLINEVVKGVHEEKPSREHQNSGLKEEPTVYERMKLAFRGPNPGSMAAKDQAGEVKNK